MIRLASKWLMKTLLILFLAVVSPPAFSATTHLDQVLSLKPSADPAIEGVPFSFTLETRSKNPPTQLTYAIDAWDLKGDRYAQLVGKDTPDHYYGGYENRHFIKIPPNTCVGTSPGQWSCTIPAPISPWEGSGTDRVYLADLAFDDDIYFHASELPQFTIQVKNTRPPALALFQAVDPSSIKIKDGGKFNIHVVVKSDPPIRDFLGEMNDYTTEITAVEGPAGFWKAEVPFKVDPCSPVGNTNIIFCVRNDSGYTTVHSIPVLLEGPDEQPVISDLQSSIGTLPKDENAEFSISYDVQSLCPLKEFDIHMALPPDTTVRSADHAHCCTVPTCQLISQGQGSPSTWKCSQNGSVDWYANPGDYVFGEITVGNSAGLSASWQGPPLIINKPK